MIRAVAVIAACLLLAPAPVRVQTLEPIIDVHLHASAANSQGPPPLGICTPIDPMPVWTQQMPFADEFLAGLKKPPCADPVWSPMTDEALMQQTIAAVRRLNVFGLLSGRGARLDAWVAAAPDRFMPAVALSVADANPPTVASLRQLHAEGKLREVARVFDARRLPDARRFYRYLQGIVDAGFSNRVMFGSDQMVWPGTIERSIKVINEASFLSASQKRDILYNNAVRFLRLSKEEIARHQGR